MNSHFTVVVHVKSAQGERTYKTDAGIPFECVEFVRRHVVLFFMRHAVWCICVCFA
jgi:hypothetical protein